MSPSNERTRRGRLVRVLLVLGGMIAGVIVLGGVALYLAFGTDSTTTETAEQEDVTGLQLDNDTTGDVRIVASDDDTAAVEATLHSNLFSTVESSVSGEETMEVDASCDEWFLGLCSVDYEIRIPSGSSVHVAGGTGQIAVEGVGGNTEIENITGDVTLNETSDVTARTTTGNIDISNAEGTVDLSTTTGDVTVAGAGDSLNITATTGQINAADFDTPEIDVATTTGDQTLSVGTGSVTSEASTGNVNVVADDAFGGLTVGTTTGDVEVLVAEDVGPFRVDGDSSTGDREIDVAIDPDAGTQLDVTTTTGDVRLSTQ